MKKKHLQFNDITAPSLARRAARRGAEKGESGRMEPGVISVFFFSFPLQEAALNSSYSFQTPFLLHPSLLFCSLGHTFLPFCWNEIIYYFIQKTCRPLPFYPLQHLILAAKNTSSPATGDLSLPLSPSLRLSLSPSPSPSSHARSPTFCLASSKCNRCLAQ